MKTFLGAWLGTLAVGWLLLNLFGSLFGSTGLLLVGVTVIAVLVQAASFGLFPLTTYLGNFDFLLYFLFVLYKSIGIWYTDEEELGEC